MNGLPLATVLPAAIASSAADRLAALFDAHHKRLYRLARRLVPTVDDALDLVQETFVRAARKPTSIPVGFADEEAWLVRVLVNIRRDQWRRGAVRSRPR
jgi:DNA-directed RNA polymerase specialized sigma24 family protein